MLLSLAIDCVAEVEVAVLLLPWVLVIQVVVKVAALVMVLVVEVMSL